METKGVLKKPSQASNKGSISFTPALINSVQKVELTECEVKITTEEGSEKVKTFLIYKDKKFDKMV